jgi:hypothetical protein
MVRHVPLLVCGEGPVRQEFSALLAERASDVAGDEGLVLEVVTALRHAPGVLVDTGGALGGALEAVRAGHAAVTACLGDLVADPAGFAVLRADRRLGMSAALLPGLPLVATLARLRDAGEAVEQVEVSGGARQDSVDEAIAVAALLGLELERRHVRVQGDPDHGGTWRAIVEPGAPAVVRAAQAAVQESGRRVTVRTRRTGPVGLTLVGPLGDAATVAGALLADLLVFAREADMPWREHRRRTGPLR